MWDTAPTYVAAKYPAGGAANCLPGNVAGLQSVHQRTAEDKKHVWQTCDTVSFVFILVDSFDSTSDRFPDRIRGEGGPVGSAKDEVRRILQAYPSHCANLLSSSAAWRRLQAGRLNKLGKWAARTSVLQQFQQFEATSTPPKLKDGKKWQTKKPSSKNSKPFLSPGFSAYMVGQMWLLIRYVYRYPKHLAQSYSEFGPGTKQGLLWLPLGNIQATTSSGYP